MELFLALLFGLIIGSFLNVCIYRVPRKLSVASPRRSYCPGCKHELSWKENVPVLSWLIQLAKCRHCKKEISGQYPLVELLSMFAGAASYLRFGGTPTALVIYAFLATLIVITYIDLEFKIIPDVISFPGMIFGLILGIVSEYTTFLEPPLTRGALDSLLGFLIGGGFFAFLMYGYYFLTKKVGLGGGDVKLMAFFGALLGWRCIAQSIFTASVCGSVIGVPLMFIRPEGRHIEIPFGPFLALGVVLYIFADLPFFRF